MKLLAKKGNRRLYEEEFGMYWFETQLDLDNTELSEDGEDSLEKKGAIKRLEFDLYGLGSGGLAREAFIELKKVIEPMLIRFWLEGRLK